MHQEAPSTTAQISNAFVKLHKEHYGKGPTKVKTHIMDGVVLCVLRGGFTKVEKTLIEAGEEEAVLTVRHAFQAAMKERFIDVVEEAVGRRVVAYLSQVHTDPDVSAELFILDQPPEADTGGDAEALAEPF
jgi:uncharacterized protein YbcI